MYNKLKEAQKTEKKYSLKQEVPTRWNSAYYMIDRILSMYDAINSVFLMVSKAPLPFTADEIDLLNDLAKLLSPFESATKQISSSTTVTISLKIPITCGLMHNLDKIKNNLTTTEGLEAYTCLIDGIKNRMSKYEERSLPRIATLLDPRFKKQGYRSPFNAVQGEKLLENELASLDSLDSDQPEPLTLTEKTTKTSQTLFEFVQNNIQAVPRTKRSNAILELRQYLLKMNSEEDVDPLKYWKVIVLIF